MSAGDPVVVSVFADGPGGGNPAPVVLDARGMTDADMQDVARRSGHESAFVVDASGTGCDVALRFWVPNHEMNMCGHATIATTWLLAQHGAIAAGRQISVHTASGVVRALVPEDGLARISQPAGHTEALAGDHADLLAVLGLSHADLAEQPIRNATTSRTKTLVPVRDPSRLDEIQPDAAGVETVCGRLGSTGLYPYAISGHRQVDARQFPRSSGYVEDPATGIAATALVFGLLADHLVDATSEPIVVRQGRAIGRPSRMTVELEVDVGGTVTGCWLSGAVASASC